MDEGLPRPHMSGVSKVKYVSDWILPNLLLNILNIAAWRDWEAWHNALKIWLHFNVDQLGTNMVWIMTILQCSQSLQHFKSHPLWSHHTIKTVPNFDFVQPGYWDIDIGLTVDMWLLLTSVCLGLYWANIVRMCVLWSYNVIAAHSGCHWCHCLTSLLYQ